MVSIEGVVVLLGLASVWAFVWLYIISPILDRMIKPGWRRVWLSTMAAASVMALLLGIFFGQLYVTMGD
jgi:hypothetical protein